MILKKIFLCCSLILILETCRENYFPSGIYDYQIERLLTGGNCKVWLVESENGLALPLDNCTDSIFLVMSSISDSIDISKVSKQADCSVTNTYLGRANASSYILLQYTDSLIFSNGMIWKTHKVTSQTLSLIREDGLSQYLKSTVLSCPE